MSQAARRAALLAAMAANPADRRHGTRTGYVYGCRCVRCLAARRAYDADRREAQSGAVSL